MNNIECENFARASINIIIKDIMELDIIVPYIVFDYSNMPFQGAGYYMYQNPSGTIITLNMNSILELKEDNDIKTVIVYGFIHEIIHMHDLILSKYKTDKNYYTYIEDVTDFYAIQYVRNNLALIQSRLRFTFNEVFLKGIERQLHFAADNQFAFNNKIYIIKTITGALCGKINYNSDYMTNLLLPSTQHYLTIIFTDGRSFFIDLDYGTAEELNVLVNLIYLENFRFAHVQVSELNHQMVNIKLY